jgi:hypothetical protein
MGISAGWRQALASAIKTPLLFLLTLAVCFPALHVINILLGSRLSLAQTINILLFALAFNALLMASFAPIAFFFALGSGYHFMKILHVILFALCGGIAMAVLYQGLGLIARQGQILPEQGLRLFRFWILLYGFVGTQMAWTLRPFLGDPSLPFTFLRKKQKGLNFYTAVVISMRRLGKASVTELNPAHLEHRAEF